MSDFLISNKDGYKFLSENNVAHLYICGDIGLDILANEFCRDINSLRDQPIVLHIDSVGGSCIDALRIYQSLEQYKQRKTAIIEGVCMSAATFIMCACDYVETKPNSLFMVHNPMVETACGNANELTSMVQTLRKLESMYKNVYSKFTNQSVETVSKWMDETRYFTSEEAFDVGLVHHIIKEEFNNIEKDILETNAKARLVAYNPIFKNYNFMNNEDISEVKEPTEELSFKEKLERLYETLKSQIEPLNDDISEVFKPILSEFDNLIEESENDNENHIDKPIEELNSDVVAEVVDETKSEEPATTEEVKEEVSEEVIKESNKLIEEPKAEQSSKDDVYEMDKQRRVAIVEFAKELNVNGILDELLIEALSGEMTLEEFKEQTSKILAKNLSKKSNYKAVLFGGSETKNEVTKPTLRVKGDYIAHYRKLKEDGKTEEAKAFLKKYPNII